MIRAIWAPGPLGLPMGLAGLRVVVIGPGPRPGLMGLGPGLRGPGLKGLRVGVIGSGVG